MNIHVSASSLSWITAPLTRTTAIAGPGSVDLTLASTAADTDLEVTVSEVRPDGTEVYVQSGWLRASHRAPVYADPADDPDFGDADLQLAAYTAALRILTSYRTIAGVDLSPDGRWAALAIDELSQDGKSYDTNLWRLDLSGSVSLALPLAEAKNSPPYAANSGSPRTNRVTRCAARARWS